MFNAAIAPRNETSATENQMTNKSKNITIEQLSGNREVLRSYNVAVAAFIPGFGYVQSDRKYSKTTTTHVNQYTERRGTVVSQEQFEKMIAETL